MESTAVEAFRYDREREVLQLVFVDGEMVYDYPCPTSMFVQFELAPSKGGFVNEVVKPYADEHGWSKRPRSSAG